MKRKYAPAYIAFLLLQHFADELTPGNKLILDKWIASSEANQRLMKELEDPEKFRQDWESYNQCGSESAWITLQRRIEGEEKWWTRIWWTVCSFSDLAIVITIIVLLVIAFGPYVLHITAFLFTNKPI